MFPIDSEVAERIRPKLGRIIEDMQGNVLAKEFFGFDSVDRRDINGPTVYLKLE